MKKLITASSPTKIPRLYYGILFAIPLVFFLLLEGGFRFFEADDETKDPYVNISPLSIFSKERVDGVEFARITHRYARANSDTHFSILKPDNTFRIFILGGSAAAGWPHNAEETFTAYLQQAFQAAMPQKNVEVINAAMHGFASFRVRHIFDELIEMEPDAILIYSGNNEFLEKRSYSAIETLDRLANNMATVRWLRSQVVLLKTELPADELQDVALFFWKKVKRQALELREDSKQFEKVQSHYRYTMEYMVDKAKEKEIPILLGTVPVNLRDWLPTVSHNALKGSSFKQWEQLYNLSRKHLLETRYIEGIKLMNRAIELEPDHAESHFWLGRMLEAQGCFLEARQSYSRSRDLDYNPFRAISAFNNTLRSIARKSEGITLVDLEKAFEEHSGTGTPGFNLFLDYVHPNTTGNTLIAKEIFRVMTAGAAFVQEERGYDDTLDLVIQTRLFTLYAMNHQYEAAIAKVRHLFRLKEGREPTSSDTFASMPPKIREGYMVFERYKAAQKKSLLGELKDPAEKDAAKRMLQAYYEKWFPYGRF